MAIFKNTVQINNNQAGWNSSHVINAIEEAIADLGWHSGSQTNGVVTTCHAPGRADTPYAKEDITSNQWDHCGGNFTPAREREDHKYFVTVDSGAYKFQRYYIGASSTSDWINIGVNSLPDGTPLIYREQNTNTSDPLYSGASDGDTVYSHIHSSGYIEICATLADAIAEPHVPIQLNNVPTGYFVLMDSRHTDTTGLMEVPQGDVLYFGTPTFWDTVKGSDSLLTATHPLFIQDDSGLASEVYNADRVLSFDNFRAIYQVNTTGFLGSNRNMPQLDDATQDTTTGFTGGTSELGWDTRGWEQGNYYIVCKNHTGMTVEIPLVPNPGRMYGYNASFFKSLSHPQEEGIQPPYYDYTVPASGSRSSLNLRIYREYSTTAGNSSGITGIRVMDMNSSGWSDNEVFTIPGTSIGGTSPENDVVFGTNAAQSSVGAHDGTPSIRTMNIGAGLNAYWKDLTQSKLLWRCENDATKNYGVTYYLFEVTSDHKISVSSGIEPFFDNLMATGTTVADNGPKWGGTFGLDKDEDQYNLTTDSQFEHMFTTSSTPTVNQIKLVTYQATNPQDTDFAVFQFVTNNSSGLDVPYYTWFHHKGNQYGNGIWDLDYVWQGGTTSISPHSNDYLLFKTVNHQNHQNETQTLDQMDDRKAREALYGYFRDPSNSSNSNHMAHIIGSNFFDSTESAPSQTSTIVPYLREDSYDRVDFTTGGSYYSKNLNDAPYNTGVTPWTGGTSSVSSSANYYKPIKGLPICTMMAPIPYYLPDDFVVIPFDITPGQADIRVGDTITISASEVYEVIRYSYKQFFESYDGIADNRTSGVLFCARTT